MTITYLALSQTASLAVVALALLAFCALSLLLRRLW